MTLRQLLRQLPPASIKEKHISPSALEIPLSALCEDAREVMSGAVYICICGTKFDGHKVIASAVARGAACVILSDLSYAAALSVPWIAVDDTRALLLPLYLAFRGHPERHIKLFAVTGTNGKTSVTYLLEAIFARHGGCAVFGTVENRIGGEVFPSENTTPTPKMLAELLARARDRGIKYAVLEASSHALVQNRLSSLCFEVGVFLNLTEDHLDYHKSTEAYYNAKRSLFFSCKKCLFVIDDAYGKRLYADPAFAKRAYSISAKEENINSSDFYLYPPFADTEGSQKRRFFLALPDALLCLSTSLEGSFAPINASVSAACAHLAHIPLDDIADGIRSLKTILGRMECIVRNPFSVYCDYAHTPDALQKALLGLKQSKSGRLSILFGCGGDREKQKRPKMGKIAVSFADRVFLTADNSRTEPLFSILAGIVSGIPMSERHKVTLICSRADAIAKMLDTAQPNDTLLLAGKGHEAYETDASGTHPFSEKSIVKAVLARQNRKDPSFL